MAFSALLIEIALRYQFLGQNCTTIRQYSWDGAAIAAATPVQLGEAWWNHYKDAWRALAPDDLDVVRFTSVFVREIGGGLAYGEFSIPVLEQEGTRTVSAGGFTDSFSACGCRLTVGSSVTRPGQMRIPFLQVNDMLNNAVEAAFLTYAEDLATLYSQGAVLGAPVATGAIFPRVVSFGADQNTVDASQDITGFILNPYVTSQVSRRYGHGN